MMRILLCASHRLFGESLGDLLTTCGHEVVGVTGDPAEALTILREQPVDVAVIDLPMVATPVESIAGICRAVPQTAFVLLIDEADRSLLAAAAAAGLRAVAEKRQPFAEIIELLERVHAGIQVSGPPRMHTEPVELSKADTDIRWLAEFLTPRERQVLSALVCGEDTSTLARSMGISATTVRCHIQSVLGKMGAHSRLEVATTAVRAGMLSPKTGEWLIDIAS
jgi:two-component system, NarL family, nitrate/nitrite response regulator NarL